MSGHSAEEIRQHLRVYYFVFGALALLTCITVAVAELHFLSLHATIALALVIATIKGSLVACYFMHLISEKSAIFGILAVCALFFVVLLLVPAITTFTSVGVIN